MTSSSDTITPFRLSSYDVERLMRDPSPKARTDVLGKVVTNYRAERYSDHELAVAEQIFRIMMKDVELVVRKQLADEVKDIATMPRDIVLHLAQDVEEVALPVIAMSQVLSDADLEHLVESSREVSKLEAIARRPTVSERVSTALVEAHYPQVIEALLENKGAKISERSMQEVVRDFKREDALMEALAEREDLPVSVVEKLVHITSSAIAGQLKERYAVNAPSLDMAEQKAREATLLKLIEHEKDAAMLEQLADELYAEHRLSTSIIFTALARGQVDFFISALARLVQIPRVNAWKLCTDPGALGFRAIYAKSGLPESMQDAAQALLRCVLALKEEGVSAGQKAYANALASRLLTMAEEKPMEHIPYILALIRGR